jgi:hypothetical protein
MTENEAPVQICFPLPEMPDAPEGGAIHRAILRVVRDLPAVDKNGSMQLGANTVRYTKIEDVRDVLNPLLAAYGIVSYPVLMDYRTELQVAAEPMTMAQADPETKLILPGGREIRDGKIPTTRSWAEVTYGIRFVYVGDNSEVTPTAIGQAYDTNSDKALAKASTAAIKRILFETFKVTEPGEDDHQAQEPDAGNRAATTDRRVAGEGASRGQQQISAAQQQQATGTTRRSGPQPQRAAAPSAPEEPQADPQTGELPEPQAAPEESAIDRDKARLRVAVKALGFSPDQVNEIAREATGKTDRAAWVNTPTLVKKVADAAEALVAKGGESA